MSSTRTTGEAGIAAASLRAISSRRLRKERSDLSPGATIFLSPFSRCTTNTSATTQLIGPTCHDLTANQKMPAPTASSTTPTTVKM